MLLAIKCRIAILRPNYCLESKFRYMDVLIHIVRVLLLYDVITEFITSFVSIATLPDNSGFSNIFKC